MTRKPLDLKRIKEVLHLDSKTGKLYWLPRPIKEFKTEHHAKTWNTRYAGKEAGYIRNSSAACRSRRIKIDHKSFEAARLVIYLLHGTDPGEDGIILFKDGDGLNTSQENLIVVSHSQKNSRATRLRIDNTSGKCGVCWEADKNKWRAYLKINNHRKYLGLFKTKEEAISARRVAEEKYYGEFKPLV